jgi:multidrug efflux system membrane fusion protein
MTIESTGDMVSARLQPVELGEPHGNMIVVRSGLKNGQRVITTGVTLIKSGDQVRVIQ